MGTNSNKHKYSGTDDYRWKKIELIGKGSYGIVYKGIDMSTSKIVAIKNYSLTGNALQDIIILQAVKE